MAKRPLTNIKLLATRLSDALRARDVTLGQQAALEVFAHVLTGSDWHNVRAQLLRGDAAMDEDQQNPWSLPDSPELITAEHHAVARHQILVGAPELRRPALMHAALASASPMVIVLDGPVQDYPYAELLMTRQAVPHVPALIVPDARTLTYQDLMVVLDDAQRAGREVTLDLVVTDTLLRGLSNHETLRAPFPAILVFPLPEVPLRQEALYTGHGRWPHLPAHPALPHPLAFEARAVHTDVWTRPPSPDTVTLSPRSRRALTARLRTYLGLPLTEPVVVAWLRSDPYVAGLMLALGWEDHRVLAVMTRSLWVYLVGHPLPSAWTYDVDQYIAAVQAGGACSG
ncbi:hypothetical protein [Deinococcus aluminii]|uniref:Uncharacterized protein n=1 Tax=Deinococcus aluminii TaxID=1656885 RepID=A0ABP9XG39_9DEIO